MRRRRERHRPPRGPLPVWSDFAPPPPPFDPPPPVEVTIPAPGGLLPGAGMPWALLAGVDLAHPGPLVGGFDLYLGAMVTAIGVGAVLSHPRSAAVVTAFGSALSEAVTDALVPGRAEERRELYAAAVLTAIARDDYAERPARRRSSFDLEWPAPDPDLEHPLPGHLLA